MKKPQWVPRRSDAPGLVLSLLLGAASLLLVRVLPASPFVSDVLIALVLGALVVNTPLRHALGLTLPGKDRDADRYAPGLRFCGTWVLRLGIIAMGLKVQTSFFGREELLLIAGVALVALPSAFFVAHTLGALLGVRRPFVDLLAGGTMICGASAVNAIAPITRAHREEQGAAIAVMFLYSVVALLCFHPVAQLLGLDQSHAGIWSGLAVNDLSSALAVGAQMGELGGVMAAAAKSTRVMLLAPTLVVFSLLRREGTPKEQQGLGAQFPKFVLGYVALAVVRVLADRTIGATPSWAMVLKADRLLVDLAMSAVSASIGLHLALRALVASGARAAAVGGGASLTISSLTLVMIVCASRGAHGTAAMIGGAGLLFAGLAFRVTTAGPRTSRALEARFHAGAPIALAEATGVLDLLEARGELDDNALRKVIHQLHPAMGELLPIRESPLPHGSGCRWVTFWEGKSGWALVALSREPGSATPIHAHPHRLMGKAIEGVLEELTFDEIADGTYALRSRKVLGHEELVETTGLSELHLVRAVGDRPAIDLQLRGPEAGPPGRRLRTTIDPLSLPIGATFAAAVEVDDRPGHGGEGASVGRPPTVRA